MAKYAASEQSSYESGGTTSFRLEKDGDRARVIFLYEGPESIDGWSCHKFPIGSKGYTITLDCPRTSKDPLDKCPACAEHQSLCTRIFVRMLNLNTNKVEIWDRASGFRSELLGAMQYFNPLYSKVYEITRHGSGLQTKYQLQSLNDSGITKEQYEDYVKQCDDVINDYIKPIDAYESTKARMLAAQEQEKMEVQAQAQQATQGAWGAPAQGAWGQPQNQAPPPQQTPWEQPQVQQQPVQQAPAQPVQQGWGQPPQNPPQTSAQGQMPQPPMWGQAPQGWGTNNQ